MKKYRFLCGALCVAVMSLLAGSTLADGEALKDSARKTEQGFGSLLKGIGQEVKKGSDAVGAAVRKDDKGSKDKQASKGSSEHK
jgi:hypothetical protein